MKIYHGSPGFGATLTESQIEEFLKKKLNLLLGTADEKGDPYVHPVWFFYEGGKIYVSTGKNSKKEKNIRNNDRIYFCIDQEDPVIGVRGRGTAKISDDIQFGITIAEKLLLKYTGSLDNEDAKLFLEFVKSGQGITVEIIPSYYTAWDHSKVK